MGTKPLDKNVQAIIDHEVHRVLRDIAYDKDVTLKELIREVLTEYANAAIKTSQLKRTLSVP